MHKIVGDYTLTEYLGKGEYGKVYKGLNLDTKIEVAMKMIEVDRFIEIGKLVQLTQNELHTLKLLENNPNVIRFIELIKTKRYIYLVYQYCEGGTLQQLLQVKGTLQQSQALLIFKELLFAFKSLSQNNIIHRDVKTNNIFFKSGSLKLADFGFCRQLKSPEDLTQTSLGSPLYMAPQVMNGDIYSSKADIWSCGVVLFEMLFGYCPYGHCNIKQLISVCTQKNNSIQFPIDLHPIKAVTEKMMKRMLQKDQFRRISWEDLFYEFQITQTGTITHRQKDFEYDLMKLIKKNSQLQNISKKQYIYSKIDWNHLTDKKSSVNSQDINPDSHSTLSQLYIIKKNIKQFQNQHGKMLQLSNIIENILNLTQAYQYSCEIIYFLVYNLGQILNNTVIKISQCTEKYQQLLERNQKQHDQLNKLMAVFNDEQKKLSLKINSIKVTLMTDENIKIQKIIKYPQRGILRKIVKKFIKQFEENCPKVTSITNQGSKEESLLLLRIIWGINLISCKEVKEFLPDPRNMTKIQVSLLLNKYLVEMGV